MSLHELFPLLTGAGGCIVALATGFWLFLLGKIRSGKLVDAQLADKDRQLAERDRRIERLEAANETERQRGDLDRQRADAAILAAQTTNQVLGALHQAVRP